MKTAYSFVVLRYVHDVMTGEFVNIGVAVYAPEAKFLGGLCNTRYGRRTSLFGKSEVDGDYFRGLMRYIEGRFDELGDKLRSELPLHGVPSDAMEIARTILPPDDSSLQWSEPGGGQTEDPRKTLEDLFARMVERYENRQPGEDASRLYEGGEYPEQNADRKGVCSRARSQGLLGVARVGHEGSRVPGIIC